MCAAVGGVAIFWLAISGCQRVETDYDPYTDFAVYKTFSWAPSQQVAESATERDYPHLMADFRETIGAALTKKGFAEAGGDGADLLLRAHLELAPYSVDTSKDAPAPQLGPLVLGPYSVTRGDDTELDRELQEGTMLLTMTVRASGEPVWQGWMRKVLDVENIREVEWSKEPGAGEVSYRHKVVLGTVERLLAKFPPEPVFRLSEEGRKP